MTVLSFLDRIAAALELSPEDANIGAILNEIEARKCLTKHAIEQNLDLNESLIVFCSVAWTAYQSWAVDPTSIETHTLMNNMNHLLLDPTGRSAHRSKKGIGQ